MLDCAQRSGPTVLVRYTYIHALTCRYWCMYISTLGCPFNFAIFFVANQLFIHIVATQ